MRIQRPTITQITELKGDGASLTGSFSGSFATWDGVTGKPDNIISSSTQLSVVTDVATTISGSLTATSASIAEDIAALTGSFSSSIAGRVTTEEVNVDLVQAHQINLLASTGSNYAHITNLNASTGSNYAHIANLNAATGSQYSHIGNIHSYTSSLKSAITVSGANTTLLGDLTVTGTRTELQVANLNVEDLNITVASGSADAASANGAGLTVDGANATLTYASTGDKWVFNKVVDVPTSGLLINATAVTSTAAELNLLDGSSAGTVVNSKGVVYGASGEVNATTLQIGGVSLDNDLATFALPASTTISAFGKTLVDDADAAAARTTLGLGSIATLSSIDISTNTNFAVSDTTGQTGINLTLTDDTVSGVVVGLGTSNDVQFDSFGVGTAASGTTGEIRATGDITAFYSSDERLKENFKTLDGALDKVNQLNGYEFDWKEGIEDIVSKTGHDIGVKAQEVQALYPELVHERDNGYLAVDYVKLTAVLLHAVKELSAKVDELNK